MYHSTNTFFLRPGRLKNTFDLLGKFHECRILMIECVGIELDLQDLTPVIFQQVYDVIPGNQRQDSDTWALKIWNHLEDLWKQKLTFVRSKTHLKEVKITIRYKAIIPDGRTLYQDLKGIESSRIFRNGSPKLNKLLDDAFDFCTGAINARVREFGIEGLHNSAILGRRSPNWGR